MVTIGEGQFTYQVQEGWGRLPDGYSFKEVAAVGCDADDNVYAFNRGAHPMIVFDQDGNFIKSWGEGVFPRAHGVTMSPDGAIFCTDDGDHTVRKCTLDGAILLTLGAVGHPVVVPSAARRRILMPDMFGNTGAPAPETPADWYWDGWAPSPPYLRDLMPPAPSHKSIIPSTALRGK